MLGKGIESCSESGGGVDWVVIDCWMTAWHTLMLLRLEGTSELQVEVTNEVRGVLVVDSISGNWIGPCV